MTPPSDDLDALIGELNAAASEAAEINGTRVSREPDLAVGGPLDLPFNPERSSEGDDPPSDGLDSPE